MRGAGAPDPSVQRTLWPRWGGREDRGARRGAMDFPQQRLPECFAGYARAEFGTPVRCPVACDPQAWAAGASADDEPRTRPEAFDGRLRVIHPTLPRSSSTWRCAAFVSGVQPSVWRSRVRRPDHRLDPGPHGRPGRPDRERRAMMRPTLLHLGGPPTRRTRPGPSNDCGRAYAFVLRSVGRQLRPGGLGGRSPGSGSGRVGTGLNQCSLDGIRPSAAFGPHVPRR